MQLFCLAGSLQVLHVVQKPHNAIGEALLIRAAIMYAQIAFYLNFFTAPFFVLKFAGIFQFFYFGGVYEYAVYVQHGTFGTAPPAVNNFVLVAGVFRRWRLLGIQLLQFLRGSGQGKKGGKKQNKYSFHT